MENTTNERSPGQEDVVAHNAVAAVLGSTTEVRDTLTGLYSRTTGTVPPLEALYKAADVISALEELGAAHTTMLVQPSSITFTWSFGDVAIEAVVGERANLVINGYHRGDRGTVVRVSTVIEALYGALSMVAYRRMTDELG